MQSVNCTAPQLLQFEFTPNIPQVACTIPNIPERLVCTPVSPQLASTQCDKQFSQQSSLVTHMRVHSDETPYACQECDKQFSCPSSLMSHVQTHHKRGERPHACVQCDKRFLSSSHLRRHEFVHTGESPYECTQCEKRFKRPSTLANHSRIHAAENDGDAMFERKRYKCSLCAKTFTQAGNLRKHERTHTGEKLPVFTCKRCDKQFTLMSSLRVHERIHTGEMPYGCAQCDKRFMDPACLRRHKRCHTDERPYTCQMCSKHFKDAGHLRRHMRIHTGECPYVCKICDREFTQSGNLQRHERLHGAAYQYTCAQCNKRFKELSSLEVHTRTHSYKHKCAQCDKRFSIRWKLKHHERTHTGERVHMCQACGKQFLHSDALVRHERIHNNNERPHACKRCNKRFVLEEYLRAHVKRCHVGVVFDSLFRTSQRKEGDGDRQYEEEIREGEVSDCKERENEFDITLEVQKDESNEMEHKDVQKDIVTKTSGNGIIVNSRVRDENRNEEEKAKYENKECKHIKQKRSRLAKCTSKRVRKYRSGEKDPGRGTQDNKVQQDEASLNTNHVGSSNKVRNLLSVQSENQDILQEKRITVSVLSLCEECPTNLSLTEHTLNVVLSSDAADQVSQSPSDVCGTYSIPAGVRRTCLNSARFWNAMRQQGDVDVGRRRLGRAYRCISTRRGLKYVCVDCHHGMYNKTDLKIHLRGVAGERVPFVCGICATLFHSPEDAKTCSLRHTGGPNSNVSNNNEASGALSCEQLSSYGCTQCGKEFSDASRLRRHARIHSSERPYVCTQCSKSFYNSSHLRSHQQRIHREVNLSHACTACKKQFTRPSYLRQHEIKHKCVATHEKIHTGARPYKCKVCTKEFNRQSHLRRHERIHSGDSNPSMCQICGKTFNQSSNLRRHELLHSRVRSKKVPGARRRENDSLREGPYVCMECGKRFLNKNSLRVHERHHDAQRTALDSAGAPRHKDIGERRFACSECEKCFVSLSSLQRHGLNHSGARPFVCEYCKKSFKQSSGLRRHERIHTGALPFACTVCGRRFNQRTHAKLHERIHTGERPYKCAQCDKTFSNSSDLTKHKRTHTGERPYACTLCDKRFIVSSNLRKHERVDHASRMSAGNLGSSVIYNPVNVNEVRSDTFMELLGSSLRAVTDQTRTDGVNALISRIDLRVVV